jgi:hypothetical protein
VNVDAAFANAIPLLVSQLSFISECDINFYAAYFVNIEQFNPNKLVKFSIVVTSSHFIVSNYKNLKNSGTDDGFDTVCYNYFNKYLANYKFNIVFSPSNVIYY